MENSLKYQKLLDFVRKIYTDQEKIPLHSPLFLGNESKYLQEVINSTYVSTAGPLIKKFEKKLSEFTGIKYCNVTVNGTAALHIALKAVGVDENTEVITQALTFVATINSIKYCGANPIFIDVDAKTLGMCHISLENFLNANCEIRNDGFCWNKKSNKKIKVILPMHTFGHPVKLDKISKLCKKYNIFLIEDAAEALGSFYKKKHVGNFGVISTLSFNGNKIITTGGGGALLTNNKQLSIKMNHMINTSKINHPWEFFHNEVGFNYRMPNLNAALGIAQLEQINKFLNIKRKIFKKYEKFSLSQNFNIFSEPDAAYSNYWLNCLILENKKEKNKLLELSHSQKIFMRPTWLPMHLLPMFKHNQQVDLLNTVSLYNSIVCLPSSVITHEKD